MIKMKLTYVKQWEVVNAHQREAMTILTPVIFRVKTTIDPGPPTFFFLIN